MPQAPESDLKNKIAAALKDSESELWFSPLTYDLVRSGLAKIYNETKISEADYGTARIIFKNSSAECFRVESINIPDECEEVANKIFVEILPREIRGKYRKQEVEFFDRTELLRNKEITDCLKNAFEIIRRVPGLFASVRLLIKSIHPIKLEDDDYDMSFSEPDIPFSVFISVPRRNTLVNALRVAEALVHEAMHLQLTLIENLVPLIVPGGELIYSPWKEELRTPQGIMHAIYVFKVIDCFYQKLIRDAVFELEEKNFLLERRNEISQQIGETTCFRTCPDFTREGKMFVQRLMFL